MEWKREKTSTGTYSYTEIQKSELDIDKTLNCGQAFRWEKHNKGFWHGVVDGKIIVLAQGKFNGTEKEVLLTNIQSSDELTKLGKYLDLNTNYTEEVEKISLSTVDSYAYQCYQLGKGIHILQQDLYEMMVTFLMSQFNSMHNIRIIINKLSNRYGNKLSTEWFGNIIQGYTFPTIERLKEVSVDEYGECSIGFRSQYLYNMIQRLNRESDILNKIKTSQNSINILKSFDGIGDKVANCISLFGLHKVDSFPIDVHIKRIINREYNGGIDISKYGEIAGIIQQYMYYAEAFIGKKE